MATSSRLRAAVVSASATCSVSHSSLSFFVLNCAPRPCRWCSTWSRRLTSPISDSVASSFVADAFTLGRRASILARASATAASNEFLSPATPASLSSPAWICSRSSVTSKSADVRFSTHFRSSRSATRRSSLADATALSLSLHSRSIVRISSWVLCWRSSSSLARSTKLRLRSSTSSSLARVSLRSFS